MRTDMQGTTGIRTYDPSVLVDEDVSCIRTRDYSALHTKIQLRKSWASYYVNYVNQ
jgi:hypothetical protein